MFKTCICLLAAGLLVLAGCTHQAGPGTEEETELPAPDPDVVLQNGSFEQIQNGLPIGWNKHIWGGEATFYVDESGYADTNCAAILSPAGGDAAWYALVSVDPFSTYRLTGRIRTEGVTAIDGKGALINLHNMQPLQTEAITGTTGWTEVALEFETGATDEVQVNCLLGGWGKASGLAWYDDLQLERLSGPAGEQTVRIDFDAPGAPVSEYIYGQFIEHLGRCIYGGIWAEMLEDRKFFHAVDANGSPWESVGGGKVVMAERGAYVGEQMPRIELTGAGPQGMLQSRLGLLEGKEYEGYIVLQASPGVEAVQVSLLWGDEDNAKDTARFDALGGQFQRYPFAFRAGADTASGRLLVIAEGRGRVDVGTVSLMPADHVQGMRPDTLALLKELDAPVYRWPGGNFVSGYDWKDGIGPRDKRPPRKNPAWKGVEHNDFGLHEFMAFCELLDTEPYIAVNSGLGGVESAAQQVQYCNGPADTPMGRWRAENGHPEPFAVDFWGIGNEMYGDWQLGHMPLSEYTRKHNQFAEAMWEADPDLVLVGVGHSGQWSRTMLAQCAGHMSMLSEHFYRGEMRSLLQHVRQMPQSVDNIVQAHRHYLNTLPNIGERMIPLAIDEWNYWYGEHFYGELGTRYYLRDALGVAAALHAFVRHSDLVYMANYAQTVNVIGAIKTTKTEAAFATTGLVLKLYRHEFGTVPLAAETSTGPLDVAAALTEDGKALTVAVVNPTTQPQQLRLEMAGAALAEAGGMEWRIAGDDPRAYNVPGQPPAVEIVPREIETPGPVWELAPISVTLRRLPLN